MEDLVQTVEASVGGEGAAVEILAVHDGLGNELLFDALQPLALSRPIHACHRCDPLYHLKELLKAGNAHFRWRQWAHAHDRCGLASAQPIQLHLSFVPKT